MRRTNSTILFILALSLLLRADACTEQKDVNLVFGSDFVASLQSSSGFTEANDEDAVTVDAGENVDDAIQELEADFDGDITSIQVNGARFEMIANDGHDARRNGEVFVSINDGAEVKLMDWNTPNNLPGTEGFASAKPIDPATPGILFNQTGLSAVNTALQTYLDNYNDGITPNNLSFTFRATWNSSPPPTALEPDNFQWDAVLLFQVQQTTLLDVPSF